MSKENEEIKNVQLKVPVSLYKKMKLAFIEDDNKSWQDFLLTACKRYLKRDTKLTKEIVKNKKKKKKRG